MVYFPTWATGRRFFSNSVQVSWRFISVLTLPLLMVKAKTAAQAVSGSGMNEAGERHYAGIGPRAPCERETGLLEPYLE